MIKDWLGNMVKVGDEVIFTAYNGKGLDRGVVEKVNAKTVEVRTSPGPWGTHRKGFGYFIKLNREEVTND
ncbi:hypothetical protein Q19_28 [Pectobacterium phage Q19]|uniref:Uncharacterized protein n=1 Tax=Pectobacterium phage Q19 TaxID=2500576 RepID=A0A678ZKA5_9CAUD|nr:hypothetical protein Q19_28 [Pectobacterium phage Q19]